MYAGPGLWSDPSGSLRLSKSTTTASTPSATAATRFVVSIAPDSNTDGHSCRTAGTLVELLIDRPRVIAAGHERARARVPVPCSTIADELQKVTVGIEEVEAVVVAPIDGGVVRDPRRRHRHSE